MVAISSATRHELVRAVSERYRTSVSGDEKGRILDEFVALSGYHRKHAIRVLNGFTDDGARDTRAAETVRRGRPAGAHRVLGSIGSHLWQAT